MPDDCAVEVRRFGRPGLSGPWASPRLAGPWDRRDAIVYVDDARTDMRVAQGAAVSWRLSAGRHDVMLRLSMNWLSAKTEIDARSDVLTVVTFVRTTQDARSSFRSGFWDVRVDAEPVAGDRAG